MNLIQRFVNDDQGAETVEYAIVAGLLAVAAVAAISTLGGTMSIYWTFISNQVASAT